MVGLWREVLTGSTGAGLLAVVSAVIAFLAARSTSRRARATALRGQRLELVRWAAELATSASAVERELGMAVLDALVREDEPVTAAERAIAARVRDVVYRQRGRVIEAAATEVAAGA